MNELLKNLNISSADKQHLILSIKKLKAEDQVKWMISQNGKEAELTLPTCIFQALKQQQQQQQQQRQQQKPRIAIPTFHRASDPSITTSSSAHSSTAPLIHTCTTTLNANTNTTTHNTTTPTTPINFDISQFIPKRTSSSDTNVSKMLENFHPTISKTNTLNNKPKSPRINATDPDVLIKLFGKRLPVPSPRPQDSRIQVTLDADTFVRLWIKHDTTATEIKRSILHKLCVGADPIYFYFYHENGRQSCKQRADKHDKLIQTAHSLFCFSAKPLVDEELVFICTTSNDNQTNRILVVPHYGFSLVRQQLHTR